MAFNNSFLCFHNVSYFSNIQFFTLYLSLVRIQNGFRKTTPMNKNENCLSQRSLFVTQIRVANEIILLATERLEVSLQKIENWGIIPSIFSTPKTIRLRAFHAHCFPLSGGWLLTYSWFLKNKKFVRFWFQS